MQTKITTNLILEMGIDARIEIQKSSKAIFETLLKKHLDLKAQNPSLTGLTKECLDEEMTAAMAALGRIERDLIALNLLKEKVEKK